MLTWLVGVCCHQEGGHFVATVRLQAQVAAAEAHLGLLSWTDTEHARTCICTASSLLLSCASVA
jgi:hypothetical protein